MNKHELAAIAKVTHQTNKAFCEINGDFSQVDWCFAPDWQRESAMNGVKFHYEDPNASSEQSHMNWFREKQLDGWTYGPVKNAEKKEHPCMVPYDQLSKHQRIKDALFKAVVRAILDAR